MAAKDEEIGHRVDVSITHYPGIGPVETVWQTTHPNWYPKRPTMLVHTYRRGLNYANVKRLSFGIEMELTEMKRRLSSPDFEPYSDRSSVPADAYIRTTRHDYKVHRAVFESVSDFFKVLESHKDPTNPALLPKLISPLFPGVDLMDYFMEIYFYTYTGTVDLNLKNVKFVLLLAKSFGVKQLKERCEDFLIFSLKPNQLFRAIRFSQEVGLHRLELFARRYFCKHLMIVAEEMDHNEMNPNITDVIYIDLRHRRQGVPYLFKGSANLTLELIDQGCTPEDVRRGLAKVVLKNLYTSPPGSVTDVIRKVLVTVRLLDLVPDDVRKMWPASNPLIDHPLVWFFIRLACEMSLSSVASVYPHYVAHVAAFPPFIDGSSEAWLRTKAVTSCFVHNEIISPRFGRIFNKQGGFEENNLEIQDIEVAIRTIDGTDVVCGMIVKYRNIYTKEYQKTKSTDIGPPLKVCYKGVLANEERIILLEYSCVRRKYFNSLVFVTNLRNRYGFCNETDKKMVMGPVKSIPYLHDVDAVISQDPRGRAYLSAVSLKWACFA